MKPEKGTATVVGAGLLIAGTVGGIGYRLHQPANAPVQQEITAYRAGECVTLTANGSGHPEIAKADCGVDPSYTVGSIVQADAGCPSPTYIRYVWTAAGATVGALCLAENLRVGHCYQPGPTGKILGLVDCAVATRNGGEVALRLDNVSDVTRCPPNTTAYAYPIPARTYCLSAPQPTALI